MAKTIRRKSYVPYWVTQDRFEFVDPATGVRCWAGYLELEGRARAQKLRWWHEDKATWWGVRPPKPHRQETESHHRMNAKRELARWRKNPDHEVQILCKEPLDYWD